MTTRFIAVVRGESCADRPALLAAGATIVLNWAELATSTEEDDVPTVLFDGSDAIGPSDAHLDQVLDTLMSVDPDRGSTNGSRPADRDVVIATVRPVTDTLKVVDAAGVLIGTAERDEHRFVGTPIAARLRVLRAVSREMPNPTPTPVAILSALVARGATVLGSSN